MTEPKKIYDERKAAGLCVQCAKIGNAVCPRVAEALVRANLPECAPRVFAGVEELNQYMSV